MTEPVHSTPRSTPDSPGRQPARTRRAPLTRDRLLAAAVAIVDTRGLAALTMRALAAAVDVQPMSLYHHVRNKDEILDLLVDAVFSEIELPTDDQPWRTALRLRTSSVREVLGRHRWAIGLLESRRNAGPATLQHHDAMLGIMRRGGFTVAGAAHAYSLLDSYAYGFALQEAMLPFDGPDELSVVAEGFAALVTESYPHLGEMLHEYVMQPGYSFGGEFEIGLEAVLDALERWRTA